jgi:hypothetical protein
MDLIDAPEDNDNDADLSPADDDSYDPEKPSLNTNEFISKTTTTTASTTSATNQLSESLARLHNVMNHQQHGLRSNVTKSLSLDEQMQKRRKGLEQEATQNFSMLPSEHKYDELVPLQGPRTVQQSPLIRQCNPHASQLDYLIPSVEMPPPSHGIAIEVESGSGLGLPQPLEIPHPLQLLHEMQSMRQQLAVVLANQQQTHFSVQQIHQHLMQQEFSPKEQPPRRFSATVTTSGVRPGPAPGLGYQGPEGDDFSFTNRQGNDSARRQGQGQERGQGRGREQRQSRYSNDEQFDDHNYDDQGQEQGQGQRPSGSYQTSHHSQSSIGSRTSSSSNMNGQRSTKDGHEQGYGQGQGYESQGRFSNKTQNGNNNNNNGQSGGYNNKSPLEQELTGFLTRWNQQYRCNVNYNSQTCRYPEEQCFRLHENSSHKELCVDLRNYFAGGDISECSILSRHASNVNDENYRCSQVYRNMMADLDAIKARVDLSAT